MTWQEDYCKRFYSDKTGWIGGTTEFHDLCNRHISGNSEVLEVGAGPSNKTSEYLSKISKKLVGLDIDEEVKENKFLSDAYIYDGKQFPFGDERFDGVVCDYVMEHVKDPVSLCDEIRRVLVPGGVFIFRTPNVWHYVPILSRFVPMWLSNWARNLPSDAHDPYPTVYQFNSAPRCRHILKETGFEILDLSLVEKEPSYGMKSRLLFFPMMAYERIVNHTEMLSCLRANIFCSARKTDNG